VDALATLIAPAIVSAAITAILAPLMFYFLKRRDERKKRHFEVRYAEYKKYLQVLEEIVAATRIDFEQSYMKTVGSILKDIFAEPENAANHAMRLNAALDALGGRMRLAFTKATSELHGLRLVCSDKLLGMVDEFVQLQRDLMDEAIAVMANAKNVDINNPEAVMTGTMKEKGQRAQPLFDQILHQMRAELDIRGS
jgi:hypothetical protein